MKDTMCGYIDNNISLLHLMEEIRRLLSPKAYMRIRRPLVFREDISTSTSAPAFVYLKHRGQSYVLQIQYDISQPLLNRTTVCRINISPENYDIVLSIVNQFGGWMKWDNRIERIKRDPLLMP